MAEQQATQRKRAQELAESSWYLLFAKKRLFESIDEDLMAYGHAQPPTAGIIETDVERKTRVFFNKLRMSWMRTRAFVGQEWEKLINEQVSQSAVEAILAAGPPQIALRQEQGLSTPTRKRASDDDLHNSGKSKIRKQVGNSVVDGDDYPETQRLVFVFATNFRESLDPAIIRRIDLKLFVPEPNAVARSELFQKIGKLSEGKQLSEKTQGLISSDIVFCCVVMYTCNHQ